MKLIKKIKKNVISTALDTALERFVHSDYLKERVNVLPLTVLTICTKSIVNFLITAHIKTGFYLIDFCLYLTVTIVLSLYSPVLYSIYNHNLNVNHFSDTMIESIWEEGWPYIEMWRGRIFGTIGLCLIVLLFFIEVNSVMIQEFLFHTLISSIIVDYLNNLHLSNDKQHKQENNTKEISPVVNRLTQSESVIPVIIEEYTNLSKSVPVFGNMENFDPSSSSEN